MSAHQNIRLSYSDIKQTSIDMNFKDLLNVRTPQDPQDAVPKSYVDSLTSSPTTFPQIDITLEDTNPVVFWGSTIGVFTFVVQSDDPSGPKGKFVIAKNEAGIPGSVQRTISSTGPNGESLMVIWNENSGPSIMKTGSGSNGTYHINILDLNNTTGVQIKQVLFTLSGTTSVSLSGDLVGIHTIQIKTNTTNPGGPIGLFECAKSDQNQTGNINASVVTTTSTLETLQMFWNPNDGIRIAKTGANYDGDYIANFIF